jgi:dynactin 1
MARSLQIDHLPKNNRASSQKHQRQSSNDSEEKDRTAVISDTKDDSETSNDVRSQIHSYATETHALLKEIRLASASPKLVSLSPDHRSGKWQRHKHTVDYQYQTQQSVLYTLKQRSDTLRAKVDTLRQEDQQQRRPVAPKVSDKRQCSVDEVNSFTWV